MHGVRNCAFVCHARVDGGQREHVDCQTSLSACAFAPRFMSSASEQPGQTAETELRRPTRALRSLGSSTHPAREPLELQGAIDASFDATRQRSENRRPRPLTVTQLTRIRCTDRQHTRRSLVLGGDGARSLCGARPPWLRVKRRVTSRNLRVNVAIVPSPPYTSFLLYSRDSAHIQIQVFYHMYAGSKVRVPSCTPLSAGGTSRQRNTRVSGPMAVALTLLPGHAPPPAGGWLADTPGRRASTVRYDSRGCVAMCSSEVH